MLSANTIEKGKQVGFIALVVVGTIFLMNWAARKNPTAATFAKKVDSGDLKAV